MKQRVLKLLLHHGQMQSWAAKSESSFWVSGYRQDTARGLGQIVRRQAGEDFSCDNFQGRRPQL